MMQPKNFYREEKGHSIPLLFINQLAFEQKSSFTDFEQHIFCAQQFTGAFGQIALIMNAKGQLLKVYIGVNKDAMSIAMAYAATHIPPGHYHTVVPISNEALVAWSLAQYRFVRFKPTDALPRVLHIDAPRMSGVLAEANAVFLVRNLINTPTNNLGPTEFAAAVCEVAHAHDATFEQWVGEALLTDNFPAIHAVGRAAADAPRLLSLVWGDEHHPRVTLVGKGVCFDSGGLDLKSSVNMRIMKKDMGGAAIALGLAQWMMAVRLPIRLQVLIPAVENAVGSRSYRPGDVLTMRNGLTVEIDNTDAEGRLVLADALVKASEDNPELLIDFATLTGAARVAVGTEISAMFCNDDKLAEAITATGDSVGDFVWRMPLFAGYATLIESSIANLVNSSPSSYAGAITAALFLQNFVKTGLSWMHIDTMAWNVSSKPGKPEGGDAMSMMAVGHYLLQRYGQ